MSLDTHSISQLCRFQQETSTIHTRDNIDVNRSQSFDINLFQVSSSQIILFLFCSLIILVWFFQNTLVVLSQHIVKCIENRIFCFHCFLKCMYHSTLWHFSLNFNHLRRLNFICTLLSHVEVLTCCKMY